MGDNESNSHATVFCRCPHHSDGAVECAVLEAAGGVTDTCVRACARARVYPGKRPLSKCNKECSPVKPHQSANRQDGINRLVFRLALIFINCKKL